MIQIKSNTPFIFRGYMSNKHSIYDEFIFFLMRNGFLVPSDEWMNKIIKKEIENDNKAR